MLMLVMARNFLALLRLGPWADVASLIGFWYRDFGGAVYANLKAFLAAGSEISAPSP
jgi:hypothetical protein